MPFRHAPRLILLAASAAVLAGGHAAAQGPYGPGWSDYPPGEAPGYGPPPGYDAMPYGPAGYGPPPYAQRPYAQAPYAPDPYAQAPYAQTPYARGGYDPRGYNPGPYAGGGYPQAGYANAYDPYAAQRRAWRRRQAQDQAQPQPPAQAPVQADEQERYDQASAPPLAAAPSAPPAAEVAPPPAAFAFAPVPLSAPPPPPPPQVQQPAAVQPASPAPTPVAFQPAASPAAPRSVALAHRIVESASAYLAYMKTASQIGPGFADGASVARQVRIGAGYEPKQFEEGAIAYAAILALQEPNFVDGVRAAAGGDAGRARGIAEQILANPAAATGFNGADIAAARASAALRRQGDALLSAGTRVKQAAYDVQHAAWSKGDVAEPEARLAKAKALSNARFAPERTETDKLLKLVLAEQGMPAYPGEAPTSAVVSRGLALAALAVLGQAGEADADRLSPILSEERGGECLKMSKLNLFQCLAVAGPHYEDIFCLGQHAMMDTAQCVIKASGVAHPMMMTASAANLPERAAPAPVSAAPQDYWMPAGGGGGGAVSAVGVAVAARR